MNIAIFIWKHQEVCGNISDDPNDNITQSESFKYKIKNNRNTSAAGNTKDVETAVSLKYWSNFWTTLEMSLINCEINLILTWSEDCVISFATGAVLFLLQNFTFLL